MTNKPISQSSLDWMPKSVWGPIKWKELHSRSLCDLPMDHEKEWLESFIQSIPCPHCEKHFNVFCDENPPDLTSRKTFFRWVCRAHNYVSQSLGRKKYTIEEVLNENSSMFK